MGQQRAHLCIGEWCDWHNLHGLLALQIGQQRTQVVALRQFGVAAGAEEHHWLLAQVAHQIGQQFATAAIGPLQVVEGDQQRRARGDQRQQLARGFPES